MTFWNRKTRAIVSLYATMTAFNCSAQEAPGAPPLEQPQLALEIFRELVGIDTTVNAGSTRAVAALATRLRAAGFAPEDLVMTGPHPDHLNLVVRYRGAGIRPPLVLFGHLDVVAARASDWSSDPFHLVERDGYLYGRGAVDMKSKDADIVANLIRLKAEGFVPVRDIMVALTDGEEMGDYNGIDWLLRHRPELLAGEFAINLEGGGGDIVKGRHQLMEIETSERGYLDLRLEVKNKGGHSSVPVRENAIYRLAAALTRLADFNFPMRTNDDTRRFFAQTAFQESGPMRDDMLALAGLPLDTAAAGRVAAASPYYNSMLRTTCVATMLSAGHAKNALPQSAEANVNCRLLPDDSPERVVAELTRVIDDPAVAITCTERSLGGPPSPLRQDLMAAVEKISAQLWPAVVVTPVMCTGVTDARFLRASGIPVYGVSGMFGDIDDIRSHGKDERIPAVVFFEGVEFMYRFLKALSAE